MEYQTNTKDCFISDKSLSDSFGVSDKTVSRALKGLEEKGYITRSTKNVKGGKERHMMANIAAIEKALAMDKMTVERTQQQTKCPLSTDNLSIDNRQNDFIKDNIKDNKEKINMGIDKTAIGFASAVVINS